MHKNIIYVVLLLSLISCNRQKNKDEYFPGAGIPTSKMNTVIILIPSLGMEDVFTSIGLLSLEVKNLSDTPVVFPPDFGSSIFLLSKNTWTPIKNSFEYSDGNIFLPTKLDYPTGILIDFFPILSDIEKPYLIRVIVIGIVDNNQEKVGAYIDIPIKY